MDEQGEFHYDLAGSPMVAGQSSRFKLGSSVSSARGSRCNRPASSAIAPIICSETGRNIGLNQFTGSEEWQVSARCVPATDRAGPR